VSPVNRAGRVLKDASGLTVSEVLIALAIILVGLMALAWVIPVPTSQITGSNRKTTAVFLAQERLEQVKNAQWSTTPALDNVGGSGSDGSAAVANWPDEAYNAIQGYPFHRRTVRIMDCGVAPGCGNPAVQNANLRQVTVSVYFRPMTGGGTFNLNAEDGVQVFTLIAKR
jgi:hypothetical protein